MKGKIRRDEPPSGARITRNAFKNRLGLKSDTQFGWWERSKPGMPKKYRIGRYRRIEYLLSEVDAFMATLAPSV